MFCRISIFNECMNSNNGQNFAGERITIQVIPLNSAIIKSGYKCKKNSRMTLSLQIMSPISADKSNFYIRFSISAHQISRISFRVSVTSQPHLSSRLGRKLWTTKWMYGILGHKLALQGYTGPGATRANDDYWYETCLRCRVNRSTC